MESHIRVYIQANWDALRCLPPMAYKVLLSLVARADSLGRCFPSAERIAEDIACHVDTVWKCLQMLEDSHYIGYLRRNEQDLVTGRWLPNVYIVNPHFICIGLESQNQALALWTSLYSESPSPLRLFSGTNQQQEPSSKTNTIEPTPETNNNNQHPSERGNAGDAQKSENSQSEKSKKAKSEKQKPDSETDDKEQQGNAPQQSKKRGRSAENYNKNYGNPDPIAAPIPDEPLENMANRVNLLGVPIALARGFVMSYGGEMVESALLQLAAAKRHGQDVKNDAGFFRHILQNNLIDSALPEILSPKSALDWHYKSIEGLEWGDFQRMQDE